MFGFLLVTAVACSPAQRMAVGGGIALAGAGLSYLALESAAGPCPLSREADGECRYYQSRPTSQPDVALPVALGGVGVLVLGGVIMATAHEHSQLPRAQPPQAPAKSAQPEKPAALDETDAVAMAVARLALASVKRNSRPAKLLGVDDTQSSLLIEGGHAELWNLRVRTASDATWRTVGACYAYQNEWRLTSLGTSLGCPH